MEQPRITMLKGDDVDRHLMELVLLYTVRSFRPRITSLTELVGPEVIGYQEDVDAMIARFVHTFSEN